MHTGSGSRYQAPMPYNVKETRLVVKFSLCVATLDRWMTEEAELTISPLACGQPLAPADVWTGRIGLE
jgi:hypothetical protein